MIDDVTVLSEGSELRRVFFDSAQPWIPKSFLGDNLASVPSPMKCLTG